MFPIDFIFRETKDSDFLDFLAGSDIARIRSRFSNQSITVKRVVVASIYQYVVGIERMRIGSDPAGVSGWCLWMLPRDVVLCPQTCLDSKQTLWPSHFTR
jgi:hypothetical protein